MGPLIWSEIARFRNAALAFAGLHLLLLWLSSSVVPLFVHDAAKMAVGILGYSLLGLTFGLYQVLTYRRTHLWAWLVNRPLSTARIFAALSSAAAALLALVVVAPVLLMTLYTDYLTPRWVDGRHYGMTFFLFGMVMCFYWFGAFVANHPRRGGALVGILVIFFMTREASGLWIFLPLVLVLVWLGGLAFATFRPSPSSALKRPAVQLGVALPVAYALFWLLVGSITLVWSLGTIVREDGLGGFQTFAWNDYWEAGALPHVKYLDGKNAMAHGLRLGASAEAPAAARAAELLAQVDLADVYEPWGPRFSSFSDRNQLFFDDRRHELFDEEGEIRWEFSHDLMLFSGAHLRTGESAGFLGRDGAVADSPAGLERFDGIPIVIGSKWLAFRQQILGVDFELGSIDLRFELPAGETLAMAFHPHRSFVVALSDQRLYLFDPRRLELDVGLVEPLETLPVPGSDRNLAQFQVAEMIDSFLISFVFGARNFHGFDEARQIVVELPIDGDGDGGARRVVDVALDSGYPQWYRWRGFLLSPVLQHGHDLLWSAIGPDREERVTGSDIMSRPVPGEVALWTAMLTLLSVLLTYGLLAWRRLPSRDRRFWLPVACVFGLPGALACVLLTVRSESAGLESVAPSERAVKWAELGTGRSAS